jgi:transposase
VDLTDEQWEILGPSIPDPPRRADGKGRPWRDPRNVLNGILWVLRTGAPWRDLPERYPPYQTCHRRFQRWNEEGVLEEVLRALAEDLKERGRLDLSECFVDGTFVGAKKGAGRWERPSGARARSSWRWQTALVFLSPYARRALARTRSRS